MSYLVQYSDADLYKKTTSGYTFKLSNSLVICCRQKQSTISMSTMEYIAASTAEKENYGCINF